MLARVLRVCWRMQKKVQAGMAGASPATTMRRLHREASPYHGSGAPCGRHARLHQSFHSPAESYFCRNSLMALVHSPAFSNMGI